MSNRVTLNINDIQLKEKKPKKEKEVAERAEGAWDPNGNKHIFQGPHPLLCPEGAPTPWWDRDNAKGSVSDVYMDDPLAFLDGVGGLKWNPVKLPAGYMYMDKDGNHKWVTVPNSYMTVRDDMLGNKDGVLARNVTDEYNVTSTYKNSIVLPDIGVKLSDFATDDGNPVLEFLQTQPQFGKVDLLDLADKEIPASDILIPWGCSLWQHGRQMTFQYKIGSFTPHPDGSKDRYDLKTTILDALDGKTKRKAFNTGTRIECENTFAHAMVDWRSLTKAQKMLLSQKRTSGMDSRVEEWQTNIFKLLLKSVAFAHAFTLLGRAKCEKDKEIEALICEVFDLDLKKGGRIVTTYDEIRATMTNSEFGQPNKVENMLDVFNGITAYIQHKRKAYGIKDFAAQQQRLAYKILVQEDDLLEKAQQVVYQHARIQMAA